MLENFEENLVYEMLCTCLFRFGNKSHFIRYKIYTIDYTNIEVLYIIRSIDLIDIYEVDCQLTTN